ncbi:hypothetical protein RRM58_004805 [Vibrio harveyi]|nr:hypothetical protein [Vibrio harveyi]
MAFKKFVRTRVQSDEPVISISDNRFQYSAVFRKLAELHKYTHVEYFVDEDNRKVGFKFHNDSTSRDGYSTWRNRSSALEVMKRHKWVNKVALSKNSDERQFVAHQLQGMWVIQLCPAFENSVLRDKSPASLPDQSGIYRYVNANNEVVYIGKGNIKARFSAEGRKDWIFNVVEYSIIEGDDAQFEWESYWIEKYKENNDGYLPHYNKVSGRKEA